MAGISQADLAAAANISVPTLRRMEASDGAVTGFTNNVEAVRRALESAGVEFTDGDEPGVKLRKAPRGDPAASIPVADLNASNDE